MKKKSFIDSHYAKGGTYQKVIKDIATSRVCPFCPKTFKWHTKPILKRYKGWLITENFSPYSNTRHHFILVGKVHKEEFTELTTADWQAMRVLVQWAIKKFKIPGGGLIIRFGKTTHTGATVCHLHFHLVVPLLNKKGRAKTVWFPVG